MTHGEGKGDGAGDIESAGTGEADGEPLDAADNTTTERDEATPDPATAGDAPDPDDLADLAAEDWRAALAAAGELEPAVVREIIDTHGDRGRRAIEAVSEGRVKEYRDFTVVVGHRAEHIVEDGGCDCQDAAYNLDPADPDERCWHALAVDIAQRVGRVDDHDMWYSEVREFL